MQGNTGKSAGIFLAGVFAGIVIVLLYGQLVSPGDENLQVPDNPVIPDYTVPVPDYSAFIREIPADIVIRNVTLKGDASDKYISGELKNNGTKTFSATTITFGLFDTKGSGLAEATTSAPDPIDPGKVWNFYLVVTNPDAVSYKLLSVDIS